MSYPGGSEGAENWLGDDDAAQARSTFRTRTRSSPFGAWYDTHCAGLGPDEGGTERSGRADDVEAADLLLDVTDEVALGRVVVVALVHDGDDGAGRDDARRRRLR